MFHLMINTDIEFDLVRSSNLGHGYDIQNDGG